MAVLNYSKRYLAHAVVMAVIVVMGLVLGDLRTNRSSLPNPVSQIRVADGDTLQAGSERIRLWGIDAVELHQICFKGGRSINCGLAAKEALVHLVNSDKVSCTQIDTDKYQRSDSKCTVNGQDIGMQMVLQGWAVDYTYHSNGYYKSAENEARIAKRGIWATQFVNPYQWRQKHKRSER